ncbi:MAG TPA: NYN domain-containing protein [Chloroflexota bacterium]|nr:NYN domain-containing protein [Chloroflexota bacterium]
MSRLAIFIDGAYLDNLARNECGGIGIDLELLSQEVKGVIAASTPEPIDLLRTLYYNCPPYQSNTPTPEERSRYAAFRRFADALKSLRRFEFREGRLVYRGVDRDGRPIFQQKRIDLLLGLDFALLSSKGQISHIALLAGDSDLIPAMQVAKQEGVSAWLFHGPRRSKAGGYSTYHQDLWQEADERFELSTDFLIRCQKVSTIMVSPASGETLQDSPGH